MLIVDYAVGSMVKTWGCAHHFRHQKNHQSFQIENINMEYIVCKISELMNVVFFSCDNHLGAASWYVHNKEGPALFHNEVVRVFKLPRHRRLATAAPAGPAAATAITR